MNWYKFGDDIFGYGTKKHAIEYADHLAVSVALITEDELVDAMQYGIRLQDAIDDIEETQNAFREF